MVIGYDKNKLYSNILNLFRLIVNQDFNYMFVSEQRRWAEMEGNMKINFFSNGNCNNHGCEAIYLSLMDILQGNEFCAYTEFFEEDNELLNKKLNFVDIYSKKPTRIENFIYKCKYKLLKNDQVFYDYKFKPFFKSLDKRNEIFLSVGGDNYCYGYNDWLKSLNKYILKKNNEIILTGCSIEPDCLNEEMLEILRTFKIIIARESITYNALKNVGFNNVFLRPDPAFVLPTDKIEWNNNFFDTEVIGINISPLILENTNNSKLILSNVKYLIEYIIKNTKYNILLIPHVLIDGNNDYDIMKKLFKHYLSTKRVKIIKSNSATEIKGYISLCRILIAARTHASIAAYSNCVPTLVLGYSIKSKGIAKDIFGTYENYVIAVEEIKSIDILLNGYKYIENNYKEIKEKLNSVMPEYKSMCYDIKRIIEETVNE